MHRCIILAPLFSARNEGVVVSGYMATVTYTVTWHRAVQARGAAAVHPEVRWHRPHCSMGDSARISALYPSLSILALRSAGSWKRSSVGLSHAKARQHPDQVLGLLGGASR